MLSKSDLVSMSRALEGKRVLSVYVNGTERDPAVRDAWRTTLDHSLREIHRSTERSSHAEREDLSRAMELLGHRLDAFNGAIGAPGLVVFVTAQGVVYEEALNVPMPTSAVWREGPQIAPYVRALKERRSVVFLLLDTKHASLFHYREGALEHAGGLTLHAAGRAQRHMGDAPRPGFHAGVRGATGRDETQRVARAGVSRLTREASERALQLAGEDGWLLVAGLPTSRARATTLLAEQAPGRVLQVDNVTTHASVSEITEAAREGASALRDERDLAAIAELIGEAGAGAPVAVALPSVERSLEHGAVHELFLTPQFLATRPREAEAAVRRALEQGSEVEEVSRGVAARLDERGGIVARLRFVVPVGEASTATGTGDIPERVTVEKM